MSTKKTKSKNARAESNEEPRVTVGDEHLPGAVVRSVLDLQRSFIRLVSGLLVNSDIAYRKDRRLQKMMRHDPDVMGPLLQRQMAVAMLEWDLVPEDKDDRQQIEACKTIKGLIVRHFRRWHDFIRHLQESVWHGPSMANAIYQRCVNGIAPVRWIPFHPDTIMFGEHGELAMRVGLHYEPQKETVVAWESRAKIFDAREREAIVLHTFCPQGADFEEPYESRLPLSGRGLRDVVWFQWLLKQTVLQLWVNYCERYAMGIREFRYPDGNAEGKREVETMAANLLGDVTLVLPSMIGKDAKEAYSFTLHEPSSTTTDTFSAILDGYLGGKIKELIVGQSATTEATNTGLGSSVADQHAETFGRIVRFDAVSLADSLTHEFVRPLFRMNFGELAWSPRFEFNVEDVDSREFMEAVDKYVQLGGKVSRQQVRGRIGLDEPSSEEDTLQRQEPEIPEFGGGGLDYQREQRRAAFARALSA